MAAEAAPSFAVTMRTDDFRVATTEVFRSAQERDAYEEGACEVTEAWGFRRPEFIEFRTSGQ